MRRRRLLVPVLLALSGLGWAAAHAVAHHAFMSEAAMSASGLERYFSYLTTSVALCFALALPLAAGALSGKRWRGTSARSLWLFGLVPVIGFVGHTALEPLGSAPGGPSELAPVVLVGLLIQIPCGLVAVGLARQVLWLAESLARALAGPAGAQLPRSLPPHPRPHGRRTPAFRLDLAHSQRGPPLLSA
ncbi:MAG: hypothetical protein ACRDNG_03165 [Gaiellaceae bacterium]